MDTLTKKCTDKAICLLSNAGGKLAVLAVVPAAMQGSLSAKDWTGKVLDAIGGKGGGKDDRAQGQAADPKLLDKALAAANEFAASGGGGGDSGASPKAKGKAKADGGKKDKAKGGKEEEKKSDPEADRKALLKKVIKEGGKRGVEIEGAADLGGLQFFCTVVKGFERGICTEGMVRPQECFCEAKDWRARGSDLTVSCTSTGVSCNI